MDEVCRICRGEATDEEPLYHPCRCSGSIKYVHQECLLEWLRHSAKGHNCELCHTKYTFTNVYEPDMPEKLPIIAHVYHFLTLVRRASRYASLVCWVHIWYFALALALKYELELATIYGSNLSRVMPHHSVQTLLSRIAGDRQPVFEAVWPYRLLPNEIQHAAVRGTWAMIALIVVALVLVTVSTWTTEDPFFRKEIEQLQQGELGPVEQPELFDDDEPEDDGQPGGDSDDEEPLWEWGRDAAANPPEQAAPDAPDGPAQQAPAAPADEDEWENVDDLFEAEDDDVGGALAELWFNLEAFVGAPWAEQVLEIFATLAKMSLLIIAFYGFPYALGRMHIGAAVFVPAYAKAAWAAIQGRPVDLEGLVWAAQHTVIPDTVLVAVGTVVLGYVDVAVATYLAYCQFFDMMLADEAYRGLLISMVYLLSTVKVLCVVVVEMIVFPIFCGINMHAAVFPLLDASWRSTVAMVSQHPYRAAFSYWASGMLYMSLLAGFLSVCRKFLRPGVLYFVQDPSEPRHQPIRTILMNGLVNHLRKVALSALMYSFLIVGGIGTVCGIVRYVLPIVYPVRLSYNYSLADLRLWPFAAMLLIQYRDGAFAKRRWVRILRTILPVMFRRAAGVAGLTHFLFANAPPPPPGQRGTWIRAPSTDYFKMFKNLELFVPVTADDRRLDGVEGVGERELQSYTLVWSPARFWLRIGVFMVALWAMLAWAAGMLIFLPLFVGNMVSTYVLTAPATNSLVNMLIGQAVLWGVFKYHQQFLRLRNLVAVDPQLPFRMHVYTLLLGFLTDSVLSFPQLLPEPLAELVVTSRVPVASYAIYGVPLLFRERADPVPVTRVQLRWLVGLTAKFIVPRVLFSLLLPVKLQRILIVEARTGFLLINVYLLLYKTGALAYLTQWSTQARETYYSRGVQLLNLRDN